MPEIQAFRGLRYDLGHVGSLSEVIAPPYDVIGKELQDQLYKKHPANVIRLILNREEPGDDQSNNRYSRAAHFLKNWRSEGLLSTDPDPALYVYHQQFDYGGRTYTRRGFMARVRLQRFGEGNIYPTNEVQGRLEAAIQGVPPIEATDHLGVIHRLWTVTDVSVIGAVAAAISPRPVFVADGHHRYETACNYRDELSAASPLPPGHPANFVLMMCVAMEDPGMIVLPTHRLFRGLPAMPSASLIQKLGDSFTTRAAGEGPDLAQTVWDEINTEASQGALGLYAAADDRWVVARITPAGRERMAKLAAEHSKPWRDLGVSILHRLVIDSLLDGAKLPKPRYVHLVEEVVEGMGSGEFPLAALVMPATVDDIQTISRHEERMPAKSTYFYPKLLSGLVINPLE